METDTDNSWYSVFETDSLKLACWNWGFEIIVGYLFSTLHHIPRNTQCVHFQCRPRKGPGHYIGHVTRSYKYIYIYVFVYVLGWEKTSLQVNFQSTCCFCYCSLGHKHVKKTSAHHHTGARMPHWDRRGELVLDVRTPQWSSRRKLILEIARMPQLKLK